MGYIAPGAPGEPDPISPSYFRWMFVIWGVGLVAIPIAVVLIGMALIHA